MNNIINIAKINYKNNLSGKNNKAVKILLGLMVLMYGVAYVAILSDFMQDYPSIAKEILNLIFIGANISTIFFSILSLPFMLFFNKANSFYLSLPIKANQLYYANLLAYLPFIFILYIFITIPASFIYLFISKASILTIIQVLFAVVSQPLIIVSIVTISVLLIFNYIPYFKNYDRLTLFSFVLTLTLTFGLQYFISFGNNTIDFQQLLVDLNNQLSPILYYTTLSFGNIIQFIIYLVVLGLAYLAMNYCINKYYLNIVTSISQSKRSKQKLTNRTYRKRNVLLQLVTTDLKEIIRTPVYLLNIGIAPFLLPIVFIISMIFSSGIDFSMVGELIPMLREFVLTYDFDLNYLATIAFVAGIAISTFSNYSITYFSRKGQDLKTLYLYPINFNQYILTALLVSVPVLLLYLIFIIGFLVVFNFSLINILIVTSCLSLAYLGMQLISIAIDIKHPYLSYTNQTQAVKQNFNIVIFMFTCILSAVASYFIGEINIFIVLIPFIIVLLVTYKLIISKAKEILYIQLDK